jgi:hypothetical protein
MMSVANLVLESSLITQDMGDTVNRVRANAMAKMLVGHGMGIDAIQSLQDIDIVKGRIFVRYPQLIAQMLKKGFKLKWEERSHTRAALQVDPPEGYPMMSELFEFTLEDAKKAGLVGSASKQYELRPRVMLSARVVSEAYRMTGGRANVYTPEEREEITRESDSGDGSSAVFREYAERTNPYHVGEAPASDPAKQPEPAAAAPAPEAEQTPAEAKPEPEPPKAETKPAASETKAEKTETVKTDPPPPAQAKGPVAVPDPAGRESLKDFQERLSLLYDKKSPDANKKMFGSFIKGFLNVKAMPPVTEAAYRPIFRLLEDLITSYPEKLVENPNGLGLTIGVAWRETKKQLEEWAISDRCKDAVFDLMLAYHHSESGGKNTCEYIEGLWIDKLAESDMYAYLQVARRTREAHFLLDQAEATKVKISDIVARWGIDVDTAPVAGIEALLRGGAPQAPPAAAAPKVEEIPVEAEPGEEIDEVLDLFNMTEES